MASFSAKGLTNKGRTLQAKAQAGTELKYTKFVVGDGQLGGQTVANLTNVISPKKTIQINRIKMTPPNQVTIGFVLSNQDITTGFYMREIGLYALDPNDGEILYWYGNAFDTADYIPPGSAGGSDIIEKSFDILVFVGQAQNVTATIDKSLVFATQKDLNDAIAGIVIKDASITQKGIVQLSSSTSGTSESKAATEKAVKAAYDRGSAGVTAAAAAQAKADAAETPAGAQAKADVAQLAAINAAVVQAATKADAAESNAKTYTDDHVATINSKLSSVNDWLEAIDLDYTRQPAFSLTSGTATEYVVMLNPPPTTLPSGFGITILPHIDCGASPTLKIGSLAAVPLKDQKGNAYAAGKLKSGYPYTFRKVGSDFFAVSGGGGDVDISGQEIITAIYDETISEGDAVKAVIGYPSNKMPNPAVLPPAIGRGIAFSPDDIYLAVASDGNPDLTIYKRSGDTFTKLADPAVLPTGAAQGVVFSPDGIYLAVAHYLNPYITIYKRSGDTFTKLANPTTLPPFDGRGIAFSSDGTYLAIAVSASPFLTIYKRSGDTFTKLADPAVLPTGAGLNAAFSPDDLYLAIAHANSPYFTIYKRSGDTFTKLADPAVLPTAAVQGVVFSPDGNYLAITSSGPSLTIYKRSGDTFTKLVDPASMPTGIGRGVAFSPDGNYLAVASDSGPRLIIYRRRGDTFTKLNNPGELPTGSGQDMAFSSDGRVLAICQSSSPYVEIFVQSGVVYRKSNNAMTDIINAQAIGYALTSGAFDDQGQVKTIWRR